MENKILIVDDNLDSLSLVKQWLIKSGFENVTLALSGDEAIDALEHSRDRNGNCEFDLILLDIVMPGRDGIETCSLIKRNLEFIDIPIIMVTGLTDTKVLEEAFSAGAMDYIKKPFDKMELKARILSALRLKKEIDNRKTREAELMKVTEELQRANEQLKNLSMIDGLTEISNRRRFDQALKSEWDRSYRSGTPLSVILLDIDKFKLYNDTYGHLQGDECLKKVASIIAKSVNRSTDIVARYGGEEFAIILPETDLNGAKVIAELVRQNVVDSKIKHRSSPIKDVVTVSAGLATVYPKSTSCTLKEVLEIIDKQLYRTKNDGRNQVKEIMIKEKESLLNYD